MSARTMTAPAMLILALGGCGTSPSAPGTSATAPGPKGGAPCPAYGPTVDLGALAYDRPPDRQVRTTAGWYRLTATGFLHGGLLDPKVGRTTVAWGLSSTPPTYHPGPSTVSGALATADVVEGRATWVKLPDATLWFLNTNGARLSLQGCAAAAPAVIHPTGAAW